MDELTKKNEKLTEKLKSYGFQYVSLDLLGYRMGSMNESLDKNIK